MSIVAAAAGGIAADTTKKTDSTQSCRAPLPSAHLPVVSGRRVRKDCAGRREPVRLAVGVWLGYARSVVGAWLSLVERSVRDREVGGSNPLAPTNIPRVARAVAPARDLQARGVMRRTPPAGTNPLAPTNINCRMACRCRPLCCTGRLLTFPSLPVRFCRCGRGLTARDAMSPGGRAGHALRTG